MFICSSTPRSDVLVYIHMYMQKNLQLCIIHYFPPPRPPSLFTSLPHFPLSQATSTTVWHWGGGWASGFCTITFLICLIMMWLDTALTKKNYLQACNAYIMELYILMVILTNLCWRLPHGWDIFYYYCDCVMQLCHNVLLVMDCVTAWYGSQVQPTKMTLAGQRVLSSSEIRASDLEHGGSWVQIPSGAQIFSLSSYGWFFNTVLMVDSLFPF